MTGIVVATREELRSPVFIWATAGHSEPVEAAVEETMARLNELLNIAGTDDVGSLLRNIPITLPLFTTPARRRAEKLRVLRSLLSELYTLEMGQARTLHHPIQFEPICPSNLDPTHFAHWHMDLGDFDRRRIMLAWHIRRHIYDPRARSGQTPTVGPNLVDQAMEYQAAGLIGRYGISTWFLALRHFVWRILTRLNLVNWPEPRRFMKSKIRYYFLMNTFQGDQPTPRNEPTGPMSELAERDVLVYLLRAIGAEAYNKRDWSAFGLKSTNMEGVEMVVFDPAGHHGLSLQEIDAQDQYDRYEDFSFDVSDFLVVDRGSVALGLGAHKDEVNRKRANPSTINLTAIRDTPMVADSHEVSKAAHMIDPGSGSYEEGKHVLGGSTGSNMGQGWMNQQTAKELQVRLAYAQPDYFDMAPTDSRSFAAAAKGHKSWILWGVVAGMLLNSWLMLPAGFWATAITAFLGPNLSAGVIARIVINFASHVPSNLGILVLGAILGPIFRTYLDTIFGLRIFSAFSPMASEDKASVERQARMALGIGMIIRFGITRSFNIIYFKLREVASHQSWWTAPARWATGQKQMRADKDQQENDYFSGLTPVAKHFGEQDGAFYENTPFSFVHIFIAPITILFNWFPFTGFNINFYFISSLANQILSLHGWLTEMRRKGLIAGQLIWLGTRWDHLILFPVSILVHFLGIMYWISYRFSPSGEQPHEYYAHLLIPSVLQRGNYNRSPTMWHRFIFNPAGRYILYPIARVFVRYFILTPRQAGLISPDGFQNYVYRNQNDRRRDQGDPLLGAFRLLNLRTVMWSGFILTALELMAVVFLDLNNIVVLFTGLAFSVALVVAPFRMNAKLGYDAGLKEYGARALGFFAAAALLALVAGVFGPWVGYTGLRLTYLIVGLSSVYMLMRFYVTRIYIVARPWGRQADGEMGPLHPREEDLRPLRIKSELYRSLMLAIPILLFFMEVSLPGNIQLQSSPLIAAVSLSTLFHMLATFVGLLIVPGVIGRIWILGVNRGFNSPVRALLFHYFNRGEGEEQWSPVGFSRISALFARAEINIGAKDVYYARWTLFEIAWNLFLRPSNRRWNWNNPSVSWRSIAELTGAWMVFVPMVDFSIPSYMMLYKWHTWATLWDWIHSVSVSGLGSFDAGVERASTGTLYLGTHLHAVLAYMSQIPHLQWFIPVAFVVIVPFLIYRQVHLFQLAIVQYQAG